MKYPDRNYNVGQLRSEIKVVDLENIHSEYKRTEQTGISDLIQRTARKGNMIPKKPSSENREIMKEGK